MSVGGIGARARVFVRTMEGHDRILELVPRLRRYARALATAKVTADELVRATLERAAAELTLAQSCADLRVWLFGLMHDIYVRSAGEGGEAGLPAADNAGALGEGPLRRAFEQALASVPAAQREVFLLVTLEDLSYEQVAKTLNIPVGTVMSRLSRAREKLRLALMSQARVRVIK